MTEWQPIETAPKDEDVYILGVKIDTLIGGRKYPIYDVCRYMWEEGGVPVFFNDDVVCHPTHWMPLPEPPK